jgi:hypothetical protein
MSAAEVATLSEVLQGHFIAAAISPKLREARLLNVRSGFLFIKEKSPDRRVPGLALPSKGKTGARRKNKLRDTKDALTKPVWGGLTGDVVATLHVGKGATRANPMYRH